MKKIQSIAALAMALCCASTADYELGVRALRAGRAADAVRHLETAKKTSPQDAEVLYSLATAYFAAGRPEDGLSAARVLASGHGSDPAVLLAVGTLLMQQRLFREASEPLERADATHPGNPMVLSSLARAQLEHGQLSAAFESLRRLTSALHRMSAAETRSSIESALQSATELARRDATSLSYAMTAAEYSLLLGRAEEARGLLEPHRERGWADADYCHRLALAYGHTGNLRKAVEAAERSVSLAPGRADLALNLAATHQTVRDNPPPFEH